MIVLFAYGSSLKIWADALFALKKDYHRDCVVLARFNEFYFEKATVIVPFDIVSQIKLRSYKRYRHKFLSVNRRTYEILDDKILFYGFMRQSRLLDYFGDIRLIPTYDKEYDGPDIRGRFMVKHRQGVGSTGNEIVEGRVRDIVRRYSDDYQIQDLLRVERMDCVSCLCCDGVVIRCLNYTVPELISKDLYKKEHRLVLKKPDDRCFDLITQIIRTCNYSGFIEFEFMTDRSGKKYLVECNPRVSGTLRCLYPCGASPYVSALVNSYLCWFNESVRVESARSQPVELFYDGKFSCPPFYVATDGRVKFKRK